MKDIQTCIQASFFFCQLLFGISDGCGYPGVRILYTAVTEEDVCGPWNNNQCFAKSIPSVAVSAKIRHNTIQPQSPLFQSLTGSMNSVQHTGFSIYINVTLFHSLRMARVAPFIV